MRKLPFVAAAVWICSSACAGGDAQETSDSSEAQSLERPASGAGASGPAQLAEDTNPKVLGGNETHTTEGSNTNWRPIDPWLEGERRPPTRERTDPRKPGGGQQGNLDSIPDPNTPSTRSGQEGESGSSGSSSGSDDSTPSPD